VSNQGELFGRDRILELCETALKKSTADQTEILVLAQHNYLTRFANNYIHQNTAEEDINVNVRVVFGQRVGVASTNEFTKDAVQNTLQQAAEIARLQPPNPRFRSLPAPQPVHGRAIFAPATEHATPAVRAEKARLIIERARQASLEAAGAVSTGYAEIAVANSLGIRVYDRATSAGLNLVVMSEDSSGFADEMSPDFSAIDFSAAAERAVEKAKRSVHPAELEPGEYTVILEEPAVADMLTTLGYMGLSALAVQESRSFMNGHFGERITGENITLWDDGNDPAGMPMPFDFEGVPKEKVMLIEHGVARGVVYDSYTADQEPGAHSTGHALPAPNEWGPFPLNLFLATGESSIEEMVAKTERGILVTRFHYTNVVDPVRTLFTGMTRDGTFLVANGRVVRGLKNLRFTQNILAALAQVDMIGARAKLEGGFMGGAMVPALRLHGFNFTGVTQF